MKNVKRALALVLVLALALGMGVMGVGAVKYSDVPDDYAYSAEIQFLSDLDILTGYTDGTFGAERTITRAEAAAVIFRTLAGKQSASENYQGGTIFSDVPADHWASGYINFCTELGIINGYPDGTFKPEQTINYGEYVTMLVRALGLDVGKDLNFPFGYIAEATVEGVNLGVDLSAANDCPRGAVAKLTYNAILDATYKRIANNIYVTEKPTIAKDVLKLEMYEGTLSAAGYYDYYGNNAPGNGKFRLSDIKGETKTWSTVFEYDLDSAMLGKKAKVWFKPDSVTASGDKVYAVVAKSTSELNTIHISLKGDVDGKYNELTHAVNDVDKTIKLADDCKFIENNEYLNTLDKADYTAGDFYPAGAVADGGARAWLPISYKFIDNDNDGKYDFAIRNIYGFGEVTQLTSSKITIEGQKKAIDLKDDDGNAYAWNDALANVEAEDFVLYYADGAVTDGKTKFAALAGGPDFTSSLYGDTANATFQKIEPVSGELENISGNDKFIFDGKTYRAMSGSTENPDLNADATIGDEYEYYPLASFGIIAKSELITKSSGKYIVVTDIDTTAFGKNFAIAAVNEDGDEEEYTVKGNDSRNLNIYVDGVKQPAEALTKANLETLLTCEYNFFEYSTDSTGKITSLNAFFGGDDSKYFYKNIDGKDGYNKKSGLLKAKDGTSYYIDQNSLVYVLMNDAEVKVMTGGFPKLTDANGGAATATVKAVDLKKNTNEVEAIYVSTDADSATGVASKENVSGYLRGVTQFSDSTGYGYEYTIAYDGDVSAAFRTKTVKERGDLPNLENDEGAILPSQFVGGVVVFDIKADGTIGNMDLKTANVSATDLNGKKEGGKYYATYMVVDYNTSKRTIEVIPVDNGVTNGAKAKDVDDIFAAIDGANSIDFGCVSGVDVYTFDIGSSDAAKVEHSNSIGALNKAIYSGDEIVEGYLITFAYDTDDDQITAIFMNDTPVERP